MSDKTPTEIMEAAYEAILGRGDIDGFLTFFSDDAVLIEPESLPYGGTYHGKAAIKAALESVFPHYSAFSFKPEAITCTGEWFIAYGPIAVTSAKTGKSISFPLAEVARIQNGKITMIHPVYSDTKALLDTIN